MSDNWCCFPFQKYQVPPFWPGTNMVSLKIFLVFTFTSSTIALFFGPPAKVRMTTLATQAMVTKFGL